MIRDGVWGSDGIKRMPAVVRLGRAEATLEAVKLVHVDAVAVRRWQGDRPIGSLDGESLQDCGNDRQTH